MTRPDSPYWETYAMQQERLCRLWYTRAQRWKLTAALLALANALLAATGSALLFWS